MFDDERYDAEIKLNRRGNRHFTSLDIADLLECSRPTVLKYVYNGRFPHPAFGREGNGAHLWTREQVIDIMTNPQRPYTGYRKAHQTIREHGSIRGSRQHEYRKEPLCKPCKLAKNKYARDRRK